MMAIVELKNNLSAREVGGKGYSLGILAKNDFNIPKGFIITIRSFFGFLKHNSITDKIETLSSRINRENFEQKSKEIRSLILEGEIPKDLILEIKDYLNKLNVQYISVRSSAASEDSLKFSFAGMYDTFLNKRSEPNLIIVYIKKCWASLFNERAILYRLKKIMPQLEGMAVIIQEMVPAEISGITFTVHPTNKKYLLVEASYGIGDIIVGGKVEPDDYTVNKKTLEILEKIIGMKKKMSIVEDEGIKIIDVGKDLAKKQVLIDDKIKEISQIFLKVEKIFKYPQDIEWCIFEDTLWLLQSRAITGVTK